MDISNVSSDMLTTLMDGKARQISGQVAIKVLKQQIDSEQQHSQELIRMTQQSMPSVDGRGAIVDRYA